MLHVHAILAGDPPYRLWLADILTSLLPHQSARAVAPSSLLSPSTDHVHKSALESIIARAVDNLLRPATRGPASRQIITGADQRAGLLAGRDEALQGAGNV